MAGNHRYHATRHAPIVRRAGGARVARVRERGLAAEIKDFEARQYKDADGNVLLYRLYKPKDYDPAKKFPIIVFLHGAGERGNNNTAQVRDALHWAGDAVQKDHPCFILAPQCPGRRNAFELYGTKKESDQRFADYAKSAGEWKTYKLPIGRLPAGAKAFLTLVNAADQGNDAGGRRVPKCPDLRGRRCRCESRSTCANWNSPSARERKARGIGGRLDDHADRRPPREGAVRLHRDAEDGDRVEFRSTQQGFVHAVGLDEDEFFDYRWANLDWAAKAGTAGKNPSTPMRLTLDVLAGLRKEFNLDEHASISPACRWAATARGTSSARAQAVRRGRAPSAAAATNPRPRS